MQIVFVSNYINHHQIPLSEELYRLTNKSYVFIQTEPMDEERINMGWGDTINKYPYVKLFYEEEENCRRLIMESDCVIFGGAEDESLIHPRLLANKLTLRYSERLYKTGRWRFISPRGLKKKYLDHVRFNSANVYLLCAGAYVKGDFNLIHAYPHKKYKFGYFPEFIDYKDLHEYRRDNIKLEVLWAARFIDWKHPEIYVELAKKCSKANLNMHFTMIGNGELFDEIKNSAEGLGEVISFVGAKSPDEVREYMLKADVFISTSDRQEGWGAVLNEAMNSGCVTMAAKEIGAAPYLIKNGVNGYTYRSCSIRQLYNLISLIYDQKEVRLSVGTNAYNTIKQEWNAELAAKRLVNFIKYNNKYESGPLSPA